MKTNIKPNRTISPVLAGMLAYGVEQQLPATSAEWLHTLSGNEVTEEMVKVFTALGWLSSSQDPRLSKARDSATDHPVQGKMALENVAPVVSPLRADRQTATLK